MDYRIVCSVILLVLNSSTGSTPINTISNVCTISSHKPQLAHIMLMGQSLGSGDDAFPVTPTNVWSGNFMFLRGIHTWRQQEILFQQSPWLRPDNDFNLVPIINGDVASSTGETIANGLVDLLKSGLPISCDVHFLFSFAGQGSKRLRDLDKRHDDAADTRSLTNRGGGFYITSIDDAKRGKRSAEQNKLGYTVFALIWMQGEKNNDMRLSDWTPPLVRKVFLDSYAKELIDLKNDWNTDLLAITHQTIRIPMFSYQTWGAIAGQAQLLASDMDSEIYVVSPTYYMFSAINNINPFTNHYGNWIHLTGDSERWLGAQFAKVIKRVLIDGEQWKPLRPIKAWASEDSNTVFVKYWVPKPPIVLDSSWLPLAPGAGLFIRGGPVVEHVSVKTADTIALHLATPLPSQGVFTVEYASEHGLTIFDLALPSVLTVRAGESWPDGSASYEVVLQGELPVILALIKSYGVFGVASDSSSSNYTHGIIRSVYLENGKTILKGAVDELRHAVWFKTGQKIRPTWIMPYGNVRDSDTEPSNYTFVTGPRKDQKYPLWNWSVGFEDLIINR